MNATAEQPMGTATNIIPARIRKRSMQADSRFKVVEFINRSGSTSWRVSGIKRDDGTPLAKRRIRENFADEERARARQLELETEYLTGQPPEEVLKKTSLPEPQLRLAESAFLQLGDEWPRLLDAVALWKNSDARRASVDAPTIDDAAAKFKEWLTSPTCDLAEHTKRGYRLRVDMFSCATPNMRISEVTPATIREYLEKRQRPNGPTRRIMGRTSIKNDHRAICRFLSWCVEKEWLAVNPAIGPRQRSRKGGKRNVALPGILSLDQSTKLLRAAEKHKGGMLVPYVAVCLFAGLRPDSEAERITWTQVNFEDREISIEPWMTKTGIPRTLRMDKDKIEHSLPLETLFKWLKAHEGKPFYPKGWRKNFDAVKKAAGIQKWIVDGMRHTAHSHYFRLTGSYGLTAEFFGNSEDIVRRNYVNRVSTEEMRRFYALRPLKVKGEK